MVTRTALEIPRNEWRHYKPFRRTKQTEGLLATEEAQRTAAYIARQLMKKYGAQKVVLFGSLARGNFQKWSDIDIAVWGIPDKMFYQAVSFATAVNANWRIDIVDANDCSESLYQKIVEEGIDL